MIGEQRDDTMRHELIIESGCGITPFMVGDDIGDHIATLDFEFQAGEEPGFWDDYDFFGGDVEVYVDRSSGKIEAVASRVQCLYRSMNIIGMQFGFLLKLFSLEPAHLSVEKVWMNEEEAQSVYEIPDYSLQVWVDAGGVVVTVFVS